MQSQFFFALAFVCISSFKHMTRLEIILHLAYWGICGAPVTFVHLFLICPFSLHKIVFCWRGKYFPVKKLERIIETSILDKCKNSSHETAKSPCNDIYLYAKLLRKVENIFQKLDAIVASDDVASRLQVSDLYKSDLQVSSRFANNLFEI